MTLHPTATRRQALQHDDLPAARPEKAALTISSRWLNQRGRRELLLPTFLPLYSTRGGRRVPWWHDQNVWVPMKGLTWDDYIGALRRALAYRRADLAPFRAIFRQLIAHHGKVPGLPAMTPPEGTALDPRRSLPEGTGR